MKDLMDITESGAIIINVGLNFSKPDSIISQNHVCELPLN